MAHDGHDAASRALFLVVCADARRRLAASCGGVGDSALPGRIRPATAPRSRPTPPGCAAHVVPGVGLHVREERRRLRRAGRLRGVRRRRLLRRRGLQPLRQPGDAGAPASAPRSPEDVRRPRATPAARTRDGCGGVIDCGTCAAPAASAAAAGFSRCGADYRRRRAADGGSGAASPTTCASLGRRLRHRGRRLRRRPRLRLVRARPTFCGGGRLQRVRRTWPLRVAPACAPATCADPRLRLRPGRRRLREPACSAARAAGPTSAAAAARPACAATTAPASARSRSRAPGCRRRSRAGCSPASRAGSRPARRPIPVPNAIVYVPSAAAQAVQPGRAVQRSAAPTSPAIRSWPRPPRFDGTFTLTNVPVADVTSRSSSSSGRWRREFFFDVTTSCASTSVGDARTFRAPRAKGTSRSPPSRPARSTRSSASCSRWASTRASSRERRSGAGGRIHLYSAGFGTADVNGHGPGASPLDSEPEPPCMGARAART